MVRTFYEEVIIFRGKESSYKDGHGGGTALSVPSMRKSLSSAEREVLKRTDMEVEQHYPYRL